MSWKLVLGLALCLAGCEQKRAPAPDLERVAFGVAFGQEIQELSEIPIGQESNALLIRLVFRTPPDPPRSVRWELERPRKPEPERGDAGAKAPSNLDAGPTDAGLGLDRIVQFGEVTTRPGERVLDVPLAFRPGDPLGQWSVRVSLDDQQILNRPFRVVKPGPKKPRENY